MPGNADAFAAQLDQFADTVIPGQVGRLQRDLVGFVLKGVLRQSPVDTGFFRSNWQVSRGTPVFDTITPGRLGPRGSKGANAESVQEVFDREESSVEAIRPFSRTFIQNNVDYAQALEAGRSGQAPNGVVAPIIAEARVKFGGA